MPCNHLLFKVKQCSGFWLMCRFPSCTRPRPQPDNDSSSHSLASIGLFSPVDPENHLRLPCVSECMFVCFHHLWLFFACCRVSYSISSLYTYVDCATNGFNGTRDKYKLIAPFLLCQNHSMVCAPRSLSSTMTEGPSVLS